jgi:hypothetical protein
MYGRENLLLELLRKEQRALLLAGRAKVPRPAGEREQVLGTALRTDHPREAVLRAAARQKGIHGSRDNAAERAVLVFEAFLVDEGELRELVLEEAVERRPLRPPRPVDRGGFPHEEERSFGRTGGSSAGSSAGAGSRRDRPTQAE